GVEADDEAGDPIEQPLAPVEQHAVGVENRVKTKVRRGLENRLEVHAAQRLAARDVQRGEMLPYDAQDLDRLFRRHFLAQNVGVFLRAVVTREIAAVGDIKDGRK